MKKFTVILTAMIMTLALVMTSACSTGGGGMKRADADPVSQSTTDGASQTEDNSTENKPDPQPAAGKTTDLMFGFTSNEIATVALENAYAQAYNAFAVNLFKKLYEGKNELISPLSIELALSMTANGAANATKTQMENVLFNGVNIDDFNAYNMSYVRSLTEQTDISIKVANSIWFKDDPYFTVKDKFLQTNADYYNAAAYKSPFDDKTLADINGWVTQKTDGMIDKIIDEISKDAIMYLINAVLFDAEWSSKFYEEQDETFTCADGTTKQMTLMQDELYGYLENTYAEGFAKKYTGGRFAFAVMLPKAGYTVSSVVDNMTGENLTAYFNSSVKEKVVLKMPKFNLNYEADLNDALMALGMTDAFDDYNADFSKLGNYYGENIYIGFVKHKTAIEVGEAGTKAAAVTAVGMQKTTSVGPDVPEKIHYVFLNRPFVYFLLDTQTGTPIFMGTYEK